MLKYLGDGLLAIFRESGDDLGGAAKGALTAAQHILAAIDEANALHQFRCRSRRASPSTTARRPTAMSARARASTSR